MVPGARTKFGVPMFELEIFQKQMYCFEESICEIAGTFRRPPQSLGAPIVIRNGALEIVPPCPPSLRPWGPSCLQSLFLARD